MSNLTAAMMAVRSSLRHLTLETPGCLVVGQWAAALQGLVTACFIGGDVHVKQGLGKLARLRELEFGSNNQELEVEAPACLPPGITHLSLEHCCLATVPDCITRLSKVRGCPPARLPAAACLPAAALPAYRGTCLPLLLPAAAPACLPARLSACLPACCFLLLVRHTCCPSPPRPLTRRCASLPSALPAHALAIPCHHLSSAKFMTANYSKTRAPVPSAAALPGPLAEHVCGR